MGLSTVFTPTGTTGTRGVRGIGPGGHIYFAKITHLGVAPWWQIDVRYWLNGTTTLVAGDSGGYPAFIDNLKTSSSGRVAFLADNAPSRLWTWKPGSPLTVTYFDTFTNEFNIAGISPFDDRIFYSGYNYSTNNDQCRIRNSDGTLSTIASGMDVDQLCGSADPDRDINDAFFLGSASHYQAFLPGFVWDSSTGLTTRYLASNYFSEWGVSDDGRVFGRPKDEDAVVTWKNGVLSTLVSGIPGVGDKALVVHSNGRVFFGTNSANGNLWTWKEGQGLSTIITNAAYPGYLSLKISTDGRAFFGEKGDGVRFWTWKEQSCIP